MTTVVDELPLVAVVGRPNVGKSTLVNRIVGRREAIVEERPGVTRDRKVLETEWRGRRFRVVDTGGWLEGGDALERQVSRQAERAMREAEAILFVVDVATGVTDEDAAVAKRLRRAGKPVLLVANKVDNEAREHDVWEFEALGLGEAIAVSALHGRASGDLLDAVVDLLPEAGPPPPGGTETDGAPFSVAIIGRPNVGKSTLFNRLVGDERSVVHDTPGTTRDTVDTVVDLPEGSVRFVDTAGMRRKAKVDEPTEYYGLVRSLQALDRADAALVVIDATGGVTHQDQRLAERADVAGCAVVVVLNKWDAATEWQRRNALAGVDERLAFLGYAPVLRVSARTGRDVGKILPALVQARDEYRRRVPTGQLNRVLQEAQAAQPPPARRGARPRVLYATQGATDPPTFTLFATHELAAPYLRYLERRIREAFGFGPTPLKLRVRRRSS